MASMAEILQQLTSPKSSAGRASRSPLSAGDTSPAAAEEWAALSSPDSPAVDLFRLAAPTNNKLQEAIDTVVMSHVNIGLTCDNGVVELSEGVHSGRLVLSHSDAIVTLCGAGEESTVLEADTAGEAMLVVISGHLWLKDLTVRQNSAAEHSPLLWVHPGAKATIANACLECRGTLARVGMRASGGMQFASALVEVSGKDAALRVENSTLRDNRGYGIRATREATAYIQCGYVSGCGLAGIQVTKRGKVTVSDSSLHDNGCGLEACDDDTTVEASSCNISCNREHGVRMLDGAEGRFSQCVLEANGPQLNGAWDLDSKSLGVVFRSGNTPNNGGERIGAV